MKPSPNANSSERLPPAERDEHSAYDPEQYWDEKARRAVDPGAAVRLGDPLLDRCIQRSQEALIAKAMQQLGARSVKCDEMSVLDFGCGTGQWTQALDRHFQRYVGVDISNVMLESARASYPVDRFPNVAFHQLRENSIPFEDAQFDVVFSLAVLHHNRYEEQAKLVSELRRVLKNGGWLFVLEGVGERNADSKSHSYYRPLHDWQHFFEEHHFQLVWKSNCRYALLWYLCERIGTRMPSAFRFSTKSSLANAFRQTVLRLDAMFGPAFLSWTPDRLAGRCAMLLKLAKD